MSVITRASLLASTDDLENAIGDRPAVLFMSPAVEAFYGKPLSQSFRGPHRHMISVRTSESGKSLANVSDILLAVESLQVSRRGVFVAAGGGVLLDTVGLAANLYRRGVPLIKIGTTLLAQADASVGVKCGVNSDRSKNIIGSFYPPEQSLVDSRFLRSLPYLEIRSGLSEILKLGIICDAALLAEMEQGVAKFRPPDQRTDASCDELVDRAIRTMCRELQPNLFEDDLHRRVDFGHTISPQLESKLGYSITHGDAVAIDMFFFCVASNLMGLMSDLDLSRVDHLYKTVGLPRSHPALRGQDFVDRALASATAHRGMKLNMPLPHAIGHSEFLDDGTAFSNALVNHVLNRCEQRDSGPAL